VHKVPSNNRIISPETKKEKNDAYQSPVRNISGVKHLFVPRRSGRAAPYEDSTNIVRANEILEVLRIIMNMTAL
jgi:hypothetical protein